VGWKTSRRDKKIVKEKKGQSNTDLDLELELDLGR
jgi:hypothetical protein